MQTGLGEMLVAAHVEAGGTAPAQSLHAVLSLGQSAWAAQGTASAAAPQAEMARSQTALTAATAALDLAAALTTSLEAAGRPQARLPASESGHYVSSDWGRSDTTVAASHEASHTKTETRQPAPGGSQAMVNAATLRQTELQAIQAAVLSCRGNLASAARQLGIGRSTLYRKLKDVPSQAAN